MSELRDLMYQDEIREVVRTSYARIDAGGGRAVVERLYRWEEAATVPEAAVEWALGVGNPVGHAGLSEVEVVLDVGCGGGIDTVLAARHVGPHGQVIGLDLLPEMCKRARAASEEAGVADWCELRSGEMEAIPLEDASVDVVISNGVVNLSPRKSRALAEIARVLRPGGRLCVADLAVEADLPPAVLGRGAAWAGCLAGAVSERVLRAKLDRVGFAGTTIAERTPFGIDDVARYPLFDDAVIALMRRLIPAEAQAQVATALTVQAVKPSDGPAVDPRAAFVQQLVTGVRHLDEVPVTDVKAPGVGVRTLKRVEDIELKVLDVASGSATPYHTHPHAHEGVVVSGTGALVLANRREPLTPGDVFSTAPQEPHRIACVGDAPLRIVCMDCFVE